MPSEKFKFKKFEIIQDERVHKVGTDGVLLGAWVNVNHAMNMLDLGTGTGLIAIMLAQRCLEKCTIIALEADAHAKQLAELNVIESPFRDLITVVQSRVQDFNSKSQFDLIVCNPPFFNNSLKPPTPERIKQRHSDDLSYDELLVSAIKLLKPTGRLAVILPVTESKLFEQLAQGYGLNLIRYCAVFTKTEKAQERSLIEFSYQSANKETQSLTIMNSDNSWTEQYINLTKDFYLNF